MVSRLVFTCGTILWLGFLCRGADPSAGDSEPRMIPQSFPGRCRRAPPGVSVPKLHGDSGFYIKISGNPDKYQPEILYTEFLSCKHTSILEASDEEETPSAIQIKHRKHRDLRDEPEVSGYKRKSMSTVEFMSASKPKKVPVPTIDLDFADEEISAIILGYSINLGKQLEVMVKELKNSHYIMFSKRDETSGKSKNVSNLFSHPRTKIEHLGY